MWIFTSSTSVLLQCFAPLILGSARHQRQIAVSAGAFLPAATLVSKGSVKIDAAKAAETALRTLHHIRRMNPYPVEPGDPPAPSVVNQNGIQKARYWVETHPGDVFFAMEMNENDHNQ